MMWELSSSALDAAFVNGEFAAGDWAPFLRLWRTTGQYQASEQDEVSVFYLPMNPYTSLHTLHLCDLARFFKPQIWLVTVYM